MGTAPRQAEPAAIGEPQEPLLADRPVPFPRAKLSSHFARGTSALALAQYRRQEYELAAASAESARAASSDANEAWRLGVLLAAIERDRGDWARAATLFVEAAAVASPVSDFLNFQAARALARSGDPRSAQYAALVSTQGPWASDSAFLLAEAARASGEHELAAEKYSVYLSEGHTETLLEEARYRLGESLAAQGRPAEARAAWRKLVVSAPVSPWSDKARAAQPDLEASLNTSELMQRGMGYFDAMRNLESEKDFVAVLGNSDLTAEDRCQALFHRAKSVYKERKYARSAPLFEPAILACKESGNTNYEVKSAYQAGLAFGRAKEREKGARFHAYVEQYPEHSYADDARLRQAELYAELGQDAKVQELLSTLPDLYPKGDMRAVALWRLARQAYQEGRFEDALGWLEKQIALVPIETNWWAEGQAHYWLGRTLGHLGKSERAADAYQQCIRQYPLTYYSMQALNRLRESWPERFAASMTEVQDTPSDWKFEIEDRPVYASAAFASALELARLGLAAEARRELGALGFVPPANRDAATSAERLDWLLAASLLLDLAGDYEQSHWIGRWHNTDYRRAWPTGDNAIRWRLAYPLAYFDLVQEFAATYSYPANLQMAIVREESAFDPGRESHANAVGLTQMIFPTARDHTADSGIEVTRENLQHPVKNVTIGSHFLESLQQAFEGRVGLMVPGYNAGPARVREWIRARHTYDLDEFIERIKGDEARRYTKRVLGSYFAYSYLADGSVPLVRNEVPRKLGKK